MSESLVVISHNETLSPINKGYLAHNNGLPDGDVLSTHLTVIEPGFADAFRYGVSDTMRGVMQRATQANRAYDALPYNFGLLEVFGLQLADEETMGFVPLVKEWNLGLFDDPEAAVVNFHRNLIKGINASLEFQQSPLRLASLALSAS